MTFLKQLVMNTMMFGKDSVNSAVRADKQAHHVDILPLNTSDVGVTDFDLTQTKKVELIDNAYQGVRVVKILEHWVVVG